MSFLILVLSTNFPYTYSTSTEQLQETTSTIQAVHAGSTESEKLEFNISLSSENPSISSSSMFQPNKITIIASEGDLLVPHKIELGKKTTLLSTGSIPLISLIVYYLLAFRRKKASGAKEESVDRDSSRACNDNDLGVDDFLVHTYNSPQLGIGSPNPNSALGVACEQWIDAVVGISESQPDEEAGSGIELSTTWNNNGNTAMKEKKTSNISLELRSSKRTISACGKRRRAAVVEFCSNDTGGPSCFRLEKIEEEV